jgi:hypothetical protein
LTRGVKVRAARTLDNSLVNQAAMNVGDQPMVTYICAATVDAIDGATRTTAKTKTTTPRRFENLIGPE